MPAGVRAAYDPAVFASDQLFWMVTIVHSIKIYLLLVYFSLGLIPSQRWLASAQYQPTLNVRWVVQILKYRPAGQNTGIFCDDSS